MRTVVRPFDHRIASYLYAQRETGEVIQGPGKTGARGPERGRVGQVRCTASVQVEGSLFHPSMVSKVCMCKYGYSRSAKPEFIQQPQKGFHVRFQQISLWFGIAIFQNPQRGRGMCQKGS